VDKKAYRKHLADVAGVEGISAITVNGHAAEFASLTIEKQCRAIAVTREVLEERVQMIVAVRHTNSMLEAARIARKAQDEGANGLLVFPPEVMVLGCDGLLSGAGSVIANLQVALFRAVQAGDLHATKAINDRIYPTMRAFCVHPLLDMHNCMKEAVVILGRWDEAHVRPPLMKPTNAEIEKIPQSLNRAGLTAETLYKKVA
jgi:dihydrodipicolinate synthase/N-acetylneuraminate lyase